MSNCQRAEGCTKTIPFVPFVFNQEEAQQNKDRIQRGLELVHSEGLTVEEAKKRLEEEGY